MATIENTSIKSLLNYEISRANEITQQNDENIHNAIGSLIDSCNQDVLYEQVIGEVIENGNS